MMDSVAPVQPSHAGRQEVLGVRQGPASWALVEIRCGLGQFKTKVGLDLTGIVHLQQALFLVKGFSLKARIS